ncbi:MAG: hypothetical protein ABI640_13075 [Gammaproteobacteria bacterium]
MNADPTFEIEQITPSMATRYLAENRTNRPMGRGVVARYVQEMQAGEWLMNAEAIKFDWDGRLVDGQHRLAAIEKAGVPVQILVARGLDPEVFKTLDTGHKRSASDVLAIRGAKNPLGMAIALRLLHRLVNDQLHSKSRITNTQLDDLLAAHPRFHALTEEADHAPYSSGYLSGGNLMFAFYTACHVDESRARRFFRTLAGRPAAGDAIQFQAVKLRERLASTMQEIIKPPPKIRLAWLIEAWNCSIRGKGVERFSRVLTELPTWEPMPGFELAQRRRSA